MNHNQHLDPNHRYACHNRKDMRVTRGQDQDGWTEDGRRRMVERETEWLDIGCGHSFKASDPACSGCKWRWL